MSHAGHTDRAGGELYSQRKRRILLGVTANIDTKQFGGKTNVLRASADVYLALCVCLTLHLISLESNVWRIEP